MYSSNYKIIDAESTFEIIHHHSQDPSTIFCINLTIQPNLKCILLDGWWWWCDINLNNKFREMFFDHLISFRLSPSFIIHTKSYKEIILACYFKFNLNEMKRG